MRAPVGIKTYFPSVWDTAKKLGVPKKRVLELTALIERKAPGVSLLQQLRSGTIEILVLAILSRGDRSGDHVYREAREGVFGFDDSLVSGALRRLVQAGLVGVKDRDNGGINRKCYHLTPQGRARVGASLEAWMDFRKHFDRMLDVARH